MKEHIISRIKKLLKHSESAKELGSLAEAEAFAKKANELLVEHNLSMYDVAQQKDESELEEWQKYVYGETISFKDNQSGNRWRLELAEILAYYNLCSVTYKSGMKTFRVGGRMENVEVVVWMYTFISNGLLRLAQEKHVSLSPEQKLFYNRYAFLKDFLLGANKGIMYQLDQQRRNMEKAHLNMTALIKTNEKALDQFAKANNVKDGKERREIIVGEGYGMGYEAGKNFSITRPQNINQPKQTKSLK